MKRILLITSDYSPKRGGIARYYGQINRNVPDFNVLTNIVGASGERVRRASWSWLGWPRWLPLLWVVPYWKMRTKSKILAAGQILPIGTALMFMSYCFGWTYIIFIHGLDIKLATRNIWKRWLSERVLARASRIIVNSGYTKNIVNHIVADRTKIFVVYPAVSLISTPLTIDVRAKYSLVNKKILLTVSRLVGRKGIDQVINALTQVLTTEKNLVYVVIGDGPQKEHLQSLVAQINVPVLFLSNITDDELWQWYESCDIFILTPKDDDVDVEGFGIVYLEAQAHSKPIIAAPVGGVIEAVGDSAIMVNSIKETSAAIRELLVNDSLRDKLAVQSKKHVSRFSSEQQVESLKKALQAGSVSK